MKEERNNYRVLQTSNKRYRPDLKQAEYLYWDLLGVKREHVDKISYSNWHSSLWTALAELRKRCNERAKKLEQSLIDTRTTLDMLEEQEEDQLRKYKVIQ